MGYLHALAAVIALLLFFILGIPLGIITLIIDIFSREKGASFASAYVRWGAGLVRRATGCRRTLIGAENLPKGRAALYIANHRSIFDLLFTLELLPGRLAPVAKKELKNIPFLHFWMRQINTLFLDRSNIRAGVQMVIDAANLVKGGTSVLIFPEGTRNRTDDPVQEFHGGSFKIAIKAGAPVVPLTIIGTRHVFEEHMPSIHPANVTIVIGKPIETAGMPIAERKTLHERCQKEIGETYAQWSARAASGEGESSS